MNEVKQEHRADHVFQHVGLIRQIKLHQLIRRLESAERGSVGESTGNAISSAPYSFLFADIGFNEALLSMHLFLLNI